MSAAGVPDASVVLVSFNTRELLRECLLTLHRQVGGTKFETIVVDNASRDGSADMVATEFPAVRLIRSKINLGFAAANNRAFEIARGRYVVLLNSDAFLQSGALRLSVEHMDANPQVGVAGGRLVGRNGSGVATGWTSRSFVGGSTSAGAGRLGAGRLLHYQA